MDTQFTAAHLGDFSIFVVGYEQCHPKHHFSYIFHNRFLIHYIVSGKGKVITGEKEYHLSRGDMFFIGNQYCYYEADEFDPWTYIWIDFSGSIADNFFETLGVNELNPIYSTNNPELIAGCFKEMLNIDKLNNTFLVNSRFFYLLGCLIETNKNENKLINKSINKYVEQCCEFIHINYNRGINIKDVCRFIGLEYSYLSRLFMQQLHISPGQYLIDYKLSQAEHLLKNTDLSINEISIASGYNDRVSFSKAFTKKYGVSPKYYRSK